MGKFRVRLERYVQQVKVIDVDAGDAQDAVWRALDGEGDVVLGSDWGDFVDDDDVDPSTPRAWGIECLATGRTMDLRDVVGEGPRISEFECLSDHDLTGKMAPVAKKAAAKKVTAKKAPAKKVAAKASASKRPAAKKAAAKKTSAVPTAKKGA